MGLSHSRADGEDGFAVVDFETTGLSRARDRVIGIAIVHLDAPDRLLRSRRRAHCDYLRQVAAAAGATCG